MVTQESGLALFLQFTNEQGIADLDTVTAITITQFLKWGEATAKPSVWNAIWVISAFFKWLIAIGRRNLANPVVTSYHRRAKTKRLPRPYTEEEMQFIWSLLNLRGTTAIRLAVAIAEESGLRIGELCNLRTSDIDIKRQRLFVRLPNKTMVEAWVPFSDKTVKFLEAWSAERDPKLPHDFLLCGPYGTPFNRKTLHAAMSRILCKTYQGHKFNDEGLEKWSTHKLRHTMATRLVYT
jgi:integrase